MGLIVLTGCTSVVAGQASPVPLDEQTSVPATADPMPAPEVGPGTVAEAHRIAGATVQPQFVYPELDNACFPTFPVTKPEGVEFTIFVEGTAAVTYTKYGFVAGWVSCRNQLDGPRSAIAFVAEMSDPDSASVAAEELATNFVDVNGAERVEIPGFENLPAVSSTDVVDGEDKVTLEVLQPVGRMLAYFYYTDSDLERAQDDLGELLEEQRQLLGTSNPPRRTRSQTLILIRTTWTAARPPRRVTQTLSQGASTFPDICIWPSIPGWRPTCCRPTASSACTTAAVPTPRGPAISSRPTSSGRRTKPTRCSRSSPGSSRRSSPTG